MKSIIYILILTTLLFQSSGILVIYKLQQFFVQYEASLSLQKSNTSFEKIILTLDEFEKNKINSREIILNGDMYDIKSIEINESKVQLLVINDRKEKGILESISSFIHRSGQRNKKCTTQVQKLLSINYLSPNIGILFSSPPLSFNIFPFLNQNITSNYSDIATPPPKLV